jgi:hypothetical protein
VSAPADPTGVVSGAAISENPDSAIPVLDSHTHISPVLDSDTRISPVLDSDTRISPVLDSGILPIPARILDTEISPVPASEIPPIPAYVSNTQVTPVPTSNILPMSLAEVMGKAFTDNDEVGTYKGLPSKSANNVCFS